MISYLSYLIYRFLYLSLSSTLSPPSHQMCGSILHFVRLSTRISHFPLWHRCFSCCSVSRHSVCYRETEWSRYSDGQRESNWYIPGERERERWTIYLLNPLHWLWSFTFTAYDNQLYLFYFNYPQECLRRIVDPRLSTATAEGSPKSKYLSYIIIIVCFKMRK